MWRKYEEYEENVTFMIIKYSLLAGSLLSNKRIDRVSSRVEIFESFKTIVRRYDFVPRRIFLEKLSGLRDI